MNHLQLALFLIFVASALCAGSALYAFAADGKSRLNRFILLSEILLLGLIVLQLEFMLAGMLHIYNAAGLSAAVLGNYVFLWSAKARGLLKELFSSARWDLPLIGFVVLLGGFVFRNSFFLVDVDSHSTYLFAQKIWLHYKTSLFADTALDMSTFTPHFNALFYSWGLSFFPHELYFPQLIVVLWTLIAMAALFGYASYRFNRWYGLAAVMLALFNDHIFYSGANRCCIINSALIAFLFAAVYNFWEARRDPSGFRFMLGIVFLAQLLANKYQMAYIAVMLAGLGLLVHNSPVSQIRALCSSRRYWIVMAVAVFSAFTWYLKNWMATGLPAFPIMAGTFEVMNWNKEMAGIFNQAYVGPLSIAQFFKFMNYLFIWPGVKVLKISIMILSLLPLILLVVFRRKNNMEVDRLSEMLYWLSAVFLIILGLGLVNFSDPRHYRYASAVAAMFCLWGFDVIFHDIVRIKNRLWIGILLTALALPGIKIAWQQGGTPRYPSFKDNQQVLAGTMLTKDIIGRFFPLNERLDDELSSADFEKAAWDTGIADTSPLSSFLLPAVLPQVGLWCTTLVKWESYASEEAIMEDLSRHGIERIIGVRAGAIKVLSLKEYAREASQYDRFPQGIAYDYGFPEELLGRTCDGC